MQKGVWVTRRAFVTGTSWVVILISVATGAVPLSYSRHIRGGAQETPHPVFSYGNDGLEKRLQAMEKRAEELESYLVSLENRAEELKRKLESQNETRRRALKILNDDFTREQRKRKKTYWKAFLMERNVDILLEPMSLESGQKERLRIVLQRLLDRQKELELREIQHAKVEREGEKVWIEVPSLPEKGVFRREIEREVEPVLQNALGEEWRLRADMINLERLLQDLCPSDRTGGMRNIMIDLSNHRICNVTTRNSGEISGGSYYHSNRIDDPFLRDLLKAKGLWPPFPE